MNKVNLYVEGKTDQEFINALIGCHIQNASYSSFILEGNHERIARKNDRIKEGKMNIFILDSDTNTFENVQESLRSIIEEENKLDRDIRFDTFLIEKNLEFLIRSISPNKKKSLWNCIDTYARCNSAIGSPLLREVDSKTKVFIYVNAHKVPDNFKKKVYQNDNLWDLKHANLRGLVSFLKKCLGDGS